MTAITLSELEKAKLDVEHIAALATSPALTATDRLGRTKPTMEGAIAAIADITDRGPWATGQVYSAASKDIALQAGTWYRCVITHTAAALFATDLAAGRWVVHQGVTADEVPFLVIETFEDGVAGSDAAMIRRRLSAASVEALKACALNLNGDHQVSQEVGATEITGIGLASPGEQQWMTDGHKVWAQGSLRVKAQQVNVTDLPGFSKALRIQVTTAQASIGSDFIAHVTYCEASRFRPMAWGTERARDLIRYAWVKTSMAGTYDVVFLNGDRSAAADVGRFTVDAPNTWQLVATPIIGQRAPSDWTSGDIGYRCEVLLAGGGSPNLAAAVGHYFMTTGELVLPADYDPGLSDTAQLMPDFDANLRACEFFYQKSYAPATIPGTVTSFAGCFSKIAEASVSFLTVANPRFGVTMRGVPTITVHSPNSGDVGKAYNSNSAADVVLTTQNAGPKGFHAFVNGVSITAGHGLSFHFTADARIG